MLDEYLSKKEKESIRRVDEVQEGWHVLRFSGSKLNQISSQIGRYIF
jgi:hypothetical protein